MNGELADIPRIRHLENQPVEAGPVRNRWICFKAATAAGQASIWASRISTQLT
jgi:hypothetical protein